MQHKVILRAPEDADVDRIFMWENDRNMWESSPTCAPVSRLQVWQYIQNYDADPLRAGELRLIAVDSENRLPAGHVDLFEIDSHSRRAGVAVYVDPSKRRQGYGLAILTAIADYARMQLDLHQLWAHIAVDNSMSLALFKAAGYRPAGRLRSWLLRDARWVDVLIWQLLFPH
ncbi:MAG: GNAT family protein [Bacteroidales bacterium]|nr:GNAT family protein [Bacteroidales bacterium]